MSRMDRDLSGLCPEDFALDSDHVAYVQLFELFIVLFSHAVSRNVGLDIPFQILNIAERCLSHHTLGHHTPCDGYLCSLQLIIAVFDLLAVMCLVILRDNERVFAVLLKLRQLLPAYFSQLIQVWFLYVFLLL